MKFYVTTGFRDIEHNGTEYECTFEHGIDCDITITLIDGEDAGLKKFYGTYDVLQAKLTDMIAQEASDAAGEYDPELYDWRT